DSIRAYKVTGVQTCALPISGHCQRSKRVNRQPVRFAALGLANRQQHLIPKAIGANHSGSGENRTRIAIAIHAIWRAAARLLHGEIGRASWRERVDSTHVAV